MSGNNKLAVIFAVGFCAIPAQIILMREFLLVFNGNELIIGLFLAIWMLLTSGGSLAAKYLKIRDLQIPYYAVLLAWLPIILLYLIDFLRNRIFLQGIEPGILPVLLMVILLLLPFCFLSGLLFAGVTGQLLQSKDSHLADKAYGIEAIGSMAGGFLFSLVLVYLNDNFRSAGIIALLSSAAVLLFWQGRPVKPIRMILLILLPIVMIFILIAGSRFPRQFLFRNQHLLEVRDTPYGNLAVTSTSGQINLFENNVLLYSSDNPLVSEEAVHFAMLQHPFPRRVLLISGGIAGLTKEILKYKSVETLDYVEFDPIIIELGKIYTRFLKDTKINPVVSDPRIYLRRIDRKYDVIIVFLPLPSSFQINRYYTLEFMSDVKRCMNPQGAFTFSLPLTGDYLNEGSVSIYSAIFKTCGSVFRNVHLFPGQNSYFVASDQKIKTNIGQLIENKKINTDYVNYYYINETEMERNSKALIRQLQPLSSINTDFKPVAVSGFYQYWLNRFQIDFTSFRWYAIGIAALIILALAFSSPRYSGMFAAGFTVSALQVILILSFQIVYGYIYRSIGIFTAVFMAGLAMGALFRRRIMPTAPPGGLIYLQLILAGLSASVPWMIILSAGITQLPVLVHLLYVFMILLISVTTGIVFSLSVQSSQNPKTGSISGIYGADLAGASLGAFMTILFLIPLAGIKPAPYLTAAFNLMIAFIMILRSGYPKYTGKSSLINQ